jgi:ferrous iron transport protein A
LTAGIVKFHTRIVLQLIFNTAGGGKGATAVSSPGALVDLKEGQEGVIDGIDLPDAISRRLMELGFLPGSTVVAARSAPGGDPRVFRVDGSEIALRRETTAHIRLRDGQGSGVPPPIQR